MKNYDYSSYSAYFITICVADRNALLWNVGANCVRPNELPPLSDIGKIIDAETQKFIEIYCAVAQSESENKSHNIKWGIKAGFKIGTSGYQHCTCYGYDFDKKNKKLVIIPEQAEVVKFIFKLRLKGLSYGMVSNELAEKNIPSPTGKSIWSRETIRKLLSNEKYAGAVILQKTFVEDFFSGKQKKNIGEKEKYYYSNNHEAIIPLEIFEKVQET